MDSNDDNLTIVRFEPGWMGRLHDKIGARLAELPRWYLENDSSWQETQALIREREAASRAEARPANGAVPTEANADVDAAAVLASMPSDGAGAVSRKKRRRTKVAPRAQRD